MPNIELKPLFLKKGISVGSKVFLSLGLGSLFTFSAVFAQEKAPSSEDGNEVTLYSYRQPELLEPLLKAFTEQTGVKVEVVYAGKGLLERLRQEGKNSPADVLLTTDIARLAAAKKAGVTQAITQESYPNSNLNQRIPAHLRDPDGHWFGFSSRARVIYASKDRIPEGAVTSYEDLIKPEFKGRLCTRSGYHDYNIGLLASLVAHKGAKEAQNWLEGIKKNLAYKPKGNDRSQVKAIKEGACDITIGNSYYFGHMLVDEEQKKWAESVHFIYPNQQDRGTHVNISGGVLTKYAPHPKQAIQLLNYLVSDEAQKIYAETNFEYPIVPTVAASDLVKSWGDFKADELSLDEIAKNRSIATDIVDIVDYDN